MDQIPHSEFQIFKSFSLEIYLLHPLAIFFRFPGTIGFLIIRCLALDLIPYLWCHRAVLQIVVIMSIATITDEEKIDKALESALARRDYVGLRELLREIEYPIAADEHEPDLIKALGLSPDMAPDIAASTMFIESTIRDRNIEMLRVILCANGHNISRPDFSKFPAPSPII